MLGSWKVLLAAVLVPLFWILESIATGVAAYFVAHLRVGGGGGEEEAADEECCGDPDVVDTRAVSALVSGALALLAFPLFALFNIFVVTFWFGLFKLLWRHLFALCCCSRATFRSLLLRQHALQV